MAPQTFIRDQKALIKLRPRGAKIICPQKLSCIAFLRAIISVLIP